MKAFLRVMGGLCQDRGRSTFSHQIYLARKKYRRIRFLNKDRKDRLEQIREFLERSIIQTK